MWTEHFYVKAYPTLVKRIVYFAGNNEKPKQNETNKKTVVLRGTKTLSKPIFHHFMGCGMCSLLVLVSPCFRGKCSCHMQNWVFFVSCRHVTSEKRNGFLFWKSNFKMALIWKKKAIFGLLFTIFSHQGKVAKFIQHVSHSHTYTYFAHPFYFFALPIVKKKILIYQVWFFFGVISGVDSYSQHFWNNQ